MLALMEMSIVGVSARTVARVTGELCGRLDAEIAIWRSRPLSGHTWPHLFVDVRYEKVRRAGRVASQGVLIT